MVIIRRRRDATAETLDVVEMRLRIIRRRQDAQDGGVRVQKGSGREMTTRDLPDVASI